MLLPSHRSCACPGIVATITWFGAANPQAAMKRTNFPGMRTDQTTTVEMLYAFLATADRRAELPNQG